MVSLYWRDVNCTCSTVDEALQMYVGLRKIHEGEEPKKISKVKKVAEKVVPEKIVAIAGGR